MSNKEGLSAGFERAITALLRQPGLEFCGELRSSLDRDPACLKDHEADIFLGIEHFLNAAGIYRDEEILKRELSKLVREVVAQLRVRTLRLPIMSNKQPDSEAMPLAKLTHL